jgi:SPP1 gp7 family putative phage head morphogenesis protein
MSDNRAKLIARDQTAKLNSDLNRFRQDQAGVDKYVWRTSQDERVRARHRGLEGKVYEWGEPTGAEDGLPPGQPIQCRCVAQGVVEF